MGEGFPDFEGRGARNLALIALIQATLPLFICPARLNGFGQGACAEGFHRVVARVQLSHYVTPRREQQAAIVIYGAQEVTLENNEKYLILRRSFGGGARTNFLLTDLRQARRHRHAHELHGLHVFRVVIGSVVGLFAVIVAVVIDNK